VAGVLARRVAISEEFTSRITVAARCITALVVAARVCWFAVSQCEVVERNLVGLAICRCAVLSVARERTKHRSCVRCKSWLGM
jgi:hypothetical protein